MLLYYMNNKQKLPLHIAIEGNNNRIINLVPLSTDFGKEKGLITLLLNNKIDEKEN